MVGEQSKLPRTCPQPKRQDPHTGFPQPPGLLQGDFLTGPAPSSEDRPERSIHTIPLFDQWSLTIGNH